LGNGAAAGGGAIPLTLSANSDPALSPTFTCQIFNADERPVSLVNLRIHGQATDPSPSDIVTNDCGKTLGSGRICSLTVRIDNTQAYGCSVQIAKNGTSSGAGNEPKVSGIIAIRDSAGNILQKADLK